LSLVGGCEELPPPHPAIAAAKPVISSCLLYFIYFAERHNSRLTHVQAARSAEIKLVTLPMLPIPFVLLFDLLVEC